MKEISTILTPEATAFVTKLQREFGPERERLLKLREERQKEINAGKFPTFLKETAEIRNAEWKVAPAPADLNDRRVEITGPAEAKMMINALNSGANVFMADMEDALSPSWSNVISGQFALMRAVRRELELVTPEKTYRLNKEIATLLVRPRGWHLEEKNFKVDGKNISASIFDFGLYFFHNAAESLKRGSGPYFYLPKMESHLEARLWNNIFKFSQKELNIPQGSIRATVLIETILAAFEMEEILFELREHMAGLNAGRWDYIFSVIKKFRNFPEPITPDRIQISMTVPFMRAYTELLVKTCHKRGAHAIGGMAAFIPNRKDPVVTENALKKVREDKLREVTDGFDGTWVAHPDLVPVAKEIFSQRFAGKPNQKDRMRSEVDVKPEQLINFKIPDSKITEAGIRLNINVALQYIERWLAGVGAAAIHNMMEDAATAEISRAQLWQWIRHGKCTKETYLKMRGEEVQQLASDGRNYAKAAEVLDSLVIGEWSSDFLTIPAYKFLD